MPQLPLVYEWTRTADGTSGWRSTSWTTISCKQPVYTTAMTALITECLNEWRRCMHHCCAFDQWRNHGKALRVRLLYLSLWTLMTFGKPIWKKHFSLTPGWIIFPYTGDALCIYGLKAFSSTCRNTQNSTLYLKQMPHRRDVCLRRMDNGRPAVSRCVSLCGKMHFTLLWRWPLISDPDNLFSNPTHIKNIYGKFRRNRSAKYKDIASREIGVNGWTTDGRTIGEHYASRRVLLAAEV